MAGAQNRQAFHNFDIFFTSINQVLDKGMEPGHIFVEEDAYEIQSEDTPIIARDRLKREFEKQARLGKATLLRCMLLYNPNALIASVIFHFFEINIMFVSPVMINALVTFIDSDDPNLLKGVLYAVVFVLCPVMQSVVQSHFILHCRRFGLRTLGAVSCMIFEKCLRLSQPAAASFGAGAIVNIMQVDTGRFDFCFFHGNFLWSMPYMLIVGVYLLYAQLGVAAFTPLVIMGAMYPVNSIVVKKLVEMSQEISLCRDARVKLLTEVLHAVRLVKMLAWENNIYELVDEKRNAEVEQVRLFRWFALLNGFIWQGLPNLLPLATFGVYVWFGGELKPGTVFSSLALLDLIRIPMNLFPQAVQFLVQVKVGMDRIESLLNADEVEQQVASGAEYLRHASSTEASTAIRLAGAEFAWTPAKDRNDDDITNNSSSCRKCYRAIRERWGPRSRREQRALPLLEVTVNDDSIISLQPPDGAAGESGAVAESIPRTMSVALRVPTSLPLEIPKGKFVFICGAVGSGKSTLMSGLLNEVPLFAGVVETQGPVAYCSQVPWILHGTVKDNILFGDEYDADTFAQVVHACAIGPDLKDLRDGAETVIGERGINLSGGQKARISLARAAYKHRSASTFLLDDPLSAVDAHVAKHLMDECLGCSKGLLRHSTRILITHQVQYMKEADLVVVLKDGEVAACRAPDDFTVDELEAYGFKMDQDSAQVDPTTPQSGQGLERQLSSSSHFCPQLTRQLSSTSDAAGLPSEVCDGRVTALREDSSPSTNHELRLGDSRLPPTTYTARSLPPLRPTMARSLSGGDSDAGGLPARMPILQRAVSGPPHQRSTLQPPAGPVATSPRSDLSAPPSEDEQNQSPQPDTAHAAPRADTSEDREVGALSIQVWCTYAKTMGPFLSAWLLAFFFIANLMQVASAFWLAAWSESSLHQNSTSWSITSSAPIQASFPLLGLHSAIDSQRSLEDLLLMGAVPKAPSSALLGANLQGSSQDAFFHLTIYAVLTMVGVLCFVMRMAIFNYVSIKVSRSLHAQALWAVMRSPMSYLDTTPTGQVVNRFSQDMQKLDVELTGSVSGFVDSSVNFLISLVVIAVLVPLVILVLLPVAYFYGRVQRKFRTTARELQRLVSLSKSPIYQGMDEAIVGVSSIRAFEKQEYFAMQNAKRCALSCKLNFNIMCCNRWLSLRLRSLGTVPVMIVAVGLVLESRVQFMKASITGATVGLALRYALQMVDLMQGLLMNLTQTELGMVALERIRSYTQLVHEPPLQQDTDKDLGQWPTEGRIEFCDVTMRYREDLPRVLNGISFTIPGGTSLGVVGRTGAGKSSLLQAIFRMCPFEGGSIRIDGVDISSLGLHSMRRRLAIIPQDPIGFTGTLRFNLDPFQECRDEDLWQKLASVHLEDFVKSKNEGLDFHLTAGGENLSVGQRQLVCAARAFLRGCQILILDEATASVDFHTDALIQEVLQCEVATNKLTTVTIAHRINTILGSDNVLVMESGKNAEFGPTKRLAKDPKSKFYTFLHAADDH